MPTKSKIAEAARISVKDAPKGSRASSCAGSGNCLACQRPICGVATSAGWKAFRIRAPYPGGSELTFEWDYSCPTGKDCSFSCPGHVTKLSIYLGTIPLGTTEHAAAGVFYEFSTVEILRANGFSISTGMGTLSCQINGMKLDYSGPPK